jgi:hypothetical protein
MTVGFASETWPDADGQAPNILKEALTGLRKADSKLRVLDET